jgi:hypothetical protein
MKLHPYAVILGLSLGVFVLLTLRYPPFALLTTIISLLGFDLGFKARAKKIENKKNDKKKK